MALKLLQINLGRGREAQHWMVNNAINKRMDVVLISEHYARIQGSAWYQDRLGKASVYLCNPLITINRVEEGNANFVVVHTNSLRIYSCYYSPNMDINDFQNNIDKLEQHVKCSNKPVLIGGDFNSKSAEWLSAKTDDRGIIVSEMIASLGLVVLNRGRSPTYRRSNASSIIDITFASPSIASKTLKWEVLEDETLSDHQYIVLEIDLPCLNVKSNPTRTRWNTKKINKQSCLEKTTAMKSMTQMTSNQNVEEVAEHLINILTEVCNAGMKKTKVIGRSRKQAYWWNKDIALLRSECHKAKRVATRRKGDLLAMELYRNARKKLRVAIKNSKKKCWDLLCEEISMDPWGLPYRIIMEKVGNRNKIPGITNPSWAYTIVSTLFPKIEDNRYNFPALKSAEDCDLFTYEEIINVSQNLKKRKAPGSDGIPNEIISLVCESWSDIFIYTFNQCLKMGVFPKIWKKQYLVLLRKGDKPLDNPSSYRPICLLDTCGKFLEKLLLNRLEAEINRNGGLSNMQFGFRKGKSTIGAIQTVVNTAKEAMEKMRFCAIVTLDIKNAFNSANWLIIRQTMRERNFPEYLIKMVDNYLEDRILEYETEDGVKFYKVTAGVPQGSILGPFLWNLMYDGLLNLNIPTGSKLVGYADDVALIVDQPSLPLIEIVTNDCLLRVNTWLRSKNLTLAANKTEAILVTKRRSFEHPKLKVDGHEITINKTLKYLGVTLDCKLSFEPHIVMVTEKALGTAAKLARIMPNIKGPGQSTRRLISTVAYSQMLYAAPVISSAVQKNKKLQAIMQKVQRTCSIRVTSAYRTISTAAVSVLAGTPPLHLLMKERSEIYEERKNTRNFLDNQEKRRIKGDARDKLLYAWQTLWDETDKGRWTHALIPNIKTWVNRKHGEVNFYLTQIFSGHGNFGSYLKRFHKIESDTCEFCNVFVDNVEHTLIKCSSWNSMRNMFPDTSENMTVCHIINLMLLKKDNWNQCSNAIESIMREKTKRQQTRAPNP